ncbi:MAG: hypothetical protein RM022_031045 [Nostoc sp. EfeVER01]|uniref:collagen-like protein n=1 Tax=unclassified Nostoc TaxID=2593658 RepID=UPI002AD33416|nr:MULTISPECIES: hypothetical protein [unclassified Nostoc]MDZ7943838.1 hypothetical protein [Nostoc sp. EfeVER01]MDZ7992031.1 hypothetical protein [Nostoc sp. EspVER01]
MSTSSVIGSMQSALDCAGKCDCCEKLQQQIDALKRDILSLKGGGSNSIQSLVAVAVGAALTTQLKPAVNAAVESRNFGFQQTLKQMNEAIAGTERNSKAAVDTATNTAKTVKNSVADNAANIKAALDTANKANEAKFAQIAANQAKYTPLLESIGGGGGTRVVTKSAFDERLALEVARRDALLKAQAERFAEANRLARLDADLVAATANQANLKAGRALNETTTVAASVAKSAFDTSTEISGLRNVVNGFGAQVNALGKTIGKLETAVGNAVTAAAKAVGISSEALAATGRLAGRLLEAFNAIATIFTLIEQLATLNVLGGRIDAVESGLVQLGNDVSRILGKLLGLQNRIGANESLTAQVKNIALDAKGIGEAAKLQAGAAQVTATRAENFAITANANAKTAQTTADGAVRNSVIANENATTAYKQGIKAEGIGEQAKRIAGDALGKAGMALTTALTAIALYQGVRSLRGLQGIPGISGRQGERGLQGIQGVPGRDGVTTVVTLPGTPGPRGQTGRQGVPGIPGRNGRDVNPVDVAGLRTLIIQQHTQTRLNSTSQHSATRTTILTPIMAALAPIIAICKKIFDIVSKFSDAAQLALLNLINNKLGGQLPGGIGGKLTRFADWMHLDRVLNIMILASTIHNAVMLSNDIGQTLVGAINNILQLIGLKKEDGTPFSIGSVISNSIESLIKNAIGVENYVNLKESWAKANRIYQATTNVINSFLNLSQAILQASELIAAYTGKIGNALRKGGVILESAYGWMNPQPKFNRVTQTLEGLQNGASTIQMVTQAPLDVVNAVTESTTAATEFVKAVKEDDKPVNKATPIPEPDELKAQEIQSKTDSQPLNFDFSDLFDGED